MFIDSFKQHFESVADPRQSAKVTYPFFDILFGSLCAVIAGAHGWFDIREYLLGHHKWFLELGMFKVSALESASFFPKISSSHLKSITSSLDFHYDHSRTC